MRLAIVGLGLLLLGGIAVAAGVLPVADAAAVGQRVWPILLFAVAVTIVAELAAAAGVFAVVAERLARIGRGRGWVLWALVVVLAVASTIFLSLDTTAVLLTPVVILLARHHGLAPLPFALTTVWLANTGSLLLPVSNLTNLLAEQSLGLDPGAFAALMLWPAIVAIVVPCVVIAVVFRRSLGVRYQPVVADRMHDPVLFAIASFVVVALIPFLVSGLPVWIPASVAAVVLGAAFLARDRGVLRLGLVPWPLVLFASGLFLVVEAGHALGLEAVLGAVTGSGTSFIELLRLAGSGAVAANAIDNLPAYLALEPLAADSPVRLAALLIGVNAGPLITPWASLAVLLWYDRLTALGVDLPWRRYVALGLIAAPLTVVAATFALATAAGAA